MRSCLSIRGLGKSVRRFGLVLGVLLGALIDPLLSYASFRFDPAKDPLERQSFDTSDLAYKKRLTFHYTFESFYERARGDAQKEQAFPDKVRLLETLKVSEDVLLERAKEESTQTIGQAYEATQLLARIPQNAWTDSFEAEVRDKFKQAEKGFSDLFGSDPLLFSDLKKGRPSPLSSLRASLEPPQEISSPSLSSVLPAGVRFEAESNVFLSKQDFQAFLKVQRQGQNSYLLKRYTQGQKKSTAVYDFERCPDPVTLIVPWPDLEATFHLEASGTLTLTDFQREEGSFPPRFGIQTEGTFINKAPLLLEIVGLQAQAVHNFYLIKCLKGYFLISYFFNGGVLHTGNDQDQLNITPASK